MASSLGTVPEGQVQMGPKGTQWFPGPFKAHRVSRELEVEEPLQDFPFQFTQRRTEAQG